MKEKPSKYEDPSGDLFIVVQTGFSSCILVPWSPGAAEVLMPLCGSIVYDRHDYSSRYSDSDSRVSVFVTRLSDRSDLYDAKSEARAVRDENWKLKSRIRDLESQIRASTEPTPQEGNP